MNNQDEVYAYALSKTLTKVSAPATVGLYSTCQDRISLVLKQMEVDLRSESRRMERQSTEPPRSSRPSLCGCVSLMWKLLFFKPIWTQRNQNHHNVRFIHVHFSAWHFAGSDLLWAGLALRLFYAMKLNFGKLQLVLHRVAQYDEEDEVKEKKIEDSTNDWRSKKCCCCPLWLFSLLVLIIPLVILIFILIFGLPDPNSEAANNGTTSHVNVFEGLVYASFGVPAASALRFIFSMAKNLIFSQDHNITRGMDNEKVSAKLGFMNEVRKEIWFMSRFVQFMEVFEKRRIRIVLQITNVDRCPPMKIVAVLDAINILLSDEESPFISVLAVNPEVLVKKVNFTDFCFIKENQAHALLNRIVTLPFTIPPLCDYSRRTLFYNLACSANYNHKNDQIKRKSLHDVPLVEISTDNHEKHPLMTSKLDIELNEDEIEMMVKSVAKNGDSKLSKYILDDAMSMRRVINSFRMVVIIMKALDKEMSSAEKTAAWVLVANHWPCRLSWIIQCVEDAKQRAEIECTDIDKLKTLWEVFEESKAELHFMKEEIEKFLEQDGDAEMFEMFLKEDFRFTVKDLEVLEKATVNLDHSIKKEMARIREASTLRDSRWKRSLAPLPITTIINMKTKDVCEELERMNFPSKYIDIVKANDLNGPALVFGDRKDLKELLGMTFGKWAEFKMRFLIFKANKADQQTKTEPSAQRPLYHLHKRQQAD
ncbi:NTPase KAP family P-loop domain-containing protein 1 [Eucyclogobius newberryi]|uniref:NTPase KAP family P-loop domain-containing protein 1 n=1 Tax=Eucyclogobius newberryi TaxID=166745 RepID=UPI003B5B19EB